MYRRGAFGVAFALWALVACGNDAPPTLVVGPVQDHGGNGGAAAEAGNSQSGGAAGALAGSAGTGAAQTAGESAGGGSGTSGGSGAAGVSGSSGTSGGINGGASGSANGGQAGAAGASGGVAGASGVGGSAAGAAGAGAGAGGVGGGAAGGGSGGVSGSSGVGGAGGAAGAPATAIISANGAVAPGSNGVGVRGFWTTNFPSGSTVSYITASPPFASAGDQVCVAGYVGGGGTAQEWGASLVLSLNQSTMGASPGSYVPATHGVTGFGFTVSGSEVPAYLQLNYQTTDGKYCKYMVPAAGAHDFPFDSTAYCSPVGSGPAPNDNQMYEVLEIQIPSSVGSYSFKFCVTDVHAILG